VESPPTTPKASEFAKECQRCFKTFPLADTFEHRNYEQTCPDCRREAKQRQDKKRSEERAENWEVICPASYKLTRFELLPNQAAAKKVVEWKFSPKGLLLHGKTRMGKSRTAWFLLQKQHFEGRGVEHLNSSAGLHYAALFSKSTDAVEQWFNRLATVDVLLLDDVFKIKITDSFESVMFSILDRRSENLKPSIVTGNDTGETLQARLSSDRGEPLIARLREFCEPIQF
jgi:DNA replication protein DnaC